jgi:hypothetical protein
MLAASGVDEDLFEDVVFETFTCSSTDGREVELLPGGEDIEVAILKGRHARRPHRPFYRLHFTTESSGVIWSRLTGWGSLMCSAQPSAQGLPHRYFLKCESVFTIPYTYPPVYSMCCTLNALYFLAHVLDALKCM